MQTEKASPAALTGLNPWKLTRIQPARRLVELRKGAPMRSLQSLLPGRIVFGVVLVVVLAVFATLPAYADVRILSTGWQGRGLSADFRSATRIWRTDHHRRAVSLCLHPRVEHDSKNRICVTRRAVLGFHAAQLGRLRTGRVSRAPEATRIVIQSYLESVRGSRSAVGSRGKSSTSEDGSSVLVSAVLEGLRWSAVMHESQRITKGRLRSRRCNRKFGT